VDHFHWMKKVCSVSRDCDWLIISWRYFIGLQFGKTCGSIQLDLEIAS